MKPNAKTRMDHEAPLAIKEWGWRYHHMGIPTQNPMPEEEYYPHLKMYVSGFKTSPFGIEWMRFDPDCEFSETTKTVPHIAFEVDHLETALKQIKMETEISSPAEGIRVAMIIHNNAPIELIEFSDELKHQSIT
jgi:hypothetical protein